MGGCGESSLVVALRFLDPAADDVEARLLVDDPSVLVRLDVELHAIARLCLREGHLRDVGVFPNEWGELAAGTLFVATDAGGYHFHQNHRDPGHAPCSS